MIFLVQNWYVFSLNTDLIFLEKDFFVTKWQILKLKKKEKEKRRGLKVRLKFFLCDACIINLSHECGSSFKKPFFFFLKTDLIFLLQT